MRRALAYAGVTVFLSGALFAQSTDGGPKFEIADVHVSAKTQNPAPRNMSARNGRYEVKTASMVDLIRMAYGFSPDKVLGGPSWLEMDRFDIVAKVPADTTPDTQKLMLQSLLADRFKLVVHKDSRPLPTYILTAGKTPHLKKADGSGQPGCRPQTSSGPPNPNGARIMIGGGPDGPATIDLGPGMTVQFLCRNITMAAFARGMGGMLGANVGPNEVLDQTGIEGNWDFDVKWSAGLFGGPMADTGDRIPASDAIEKQLGLKLEQRPIPTPVIVVDSVNRTPTDNPPGVDAAFPAIPAPTEFEVADVRPTDPAARMGGRTQVQPGGRVTMDGVPLRMLIMQSFGTPFNRGEDVVGVPDWAMSERFDIKAKAPSEGSSGMMDMAPLLRALLVDRFKLKYHTEERPETAYTLVSAKPKMKKADPASRTSCKRGQGPANAARGSQTLTCQNITMAQFVDELRGMGPDLSRPVLDGTGIEGGWDFTLTFNPNAGMMMGPGRGGDGAQIANVPMASDPSGAISIFDAVEKQLGLKLEMHKRTLPVVVIDHIEQQPTDN